jgi:hypothetical protein
VLLTSACLAHQQETPSSSIARMKTAGRFSILPKEVTTGVDKGYR